MPDSDLLPAERRLTIVVLCQSDAEAQKWDERRDYYPALDIQIVPKAESACVAVSALLQGGRTEPFLLARGDVWFGLEIDIQVAELIFELNETVPNWALCGNLGVAADGSEAISFLQHAEGSPSYRRQPEPVLLLDDNLLLIDPTKLSLVELPAVSGGAGYGLALSLEAQRRGCCVLADRRLVAALAMARDTQAVANVVEQPVFRDWYGRYFLNHLLPGLDGPLDLAPAVAWLALDPSASVRRADIVGLHDQALMAARGNRPLSLQIVCRTMLNRSWLLTRAVQSFAAAVHDAAGMARLSVRIVTSGTDAAMQTEVERLRQLTPGIEIDGRAYDVREGRYSRMDLLLHAVEDCPADHIWFVDDDDFLLPGAMPAILRRLALAGQRLVVGASQRYEEKWEAAPDGGHRLAEWEILPAWRGEGVYRALGGMNHTPICSMVLPAAALKRAVAGVSARGDYYEDYFLLLRLLGTQPVDIAVLPTVIAGISLRDGQNTVTEIDRSRWHLSYATVMGEVLRPADLASPLAWQLATRYGLLEQAGGAEPAVPFWFHRLRQVGYLLKALWRGVTRRQALRSRMARFVELARTQGLRKALLAVINYGRIG